MTWDGAATLRLRKYLAGVHSGQLIRITTDLASAANRAGVLAQIESALGMAPEASGRSGEGLSSLAQSPVAPGIYHLGAFDVSDMGVLAGGGRKALYDAKRELPPRVLHNRDYWSFSQLVALRTWQYFRNRVGSRLMPRTLLEDLANFAGAEDAALVGVTATGRILRREEDGFFDVKTEQRALDPAIALDDVFQPFQIGGGTVPSLLRPSPYTRVHPATLGGTPTIVNHRISVRSVAMLARDVPVEEISRVYYPEVELEALADAVSFGQLLLAA
jgi:uncharacterized protein (DUF433 family)